MKSRSATNLLLIAFGGVPLSGGGPWRFWQAARLSQLDAGDGASVRASVSWCSSVMGRRKCARDEDEG